VGDYTRSGDVERNTQNRPRTRCVKNKARTFNPATEERFGSALNRVNRVAYCLPHPPSTGGLIYSSCTQGVVAANSVCQSCNEVDGVV
jgi:hypothetical protein